MTLQSDLIEANREVAGKKAAVDILLDGIQGLEGTEAEERAKAIKSAGSAFEAAAERRDEIERRFKTDQLQRNATKAARSTNDRLVMPDNDSWAMSPSSPRSAGPDWGQAIIEANEAQGGHRGTKSFLTAGTATVASSVGGPVENPARARFLAELMPAEDAPGGHFAYLRQTARTNNAAVVASAAVKPASVYSLTRVDGTTDVIAHLTEPISRQDLDDAAVLRQFIEAELRLGLNLAIDAQIVAAIIAAGPLAEGDIGSTLDTTRRSLTRLQEREVEPSAWLLSPRDWEQIENEAQNTFASNANMAPATDAVRRTLHGIPVFLSNGVPENTGYLGDFRGSAKLYTTGGIQIDWSEGHYDSVVGATDFERNLVRFRAETRVAVAILRSFAFVSIDLAATGS